MEWLAARCRQWRSRWRRAEGGSVMQFRYWPVAAIVWLLIATPTFATPNPNEIDDPTAACGKAIEKASEKFIDAVADAIEKCLLAWQKCDTKAEVEDADECKA